MRGCPGLAWAVLAVAVVAAAPAGAARLDLAIRSLPDERRVAARSVDLAPGEETRIQRRGVRLAGHPSPLDLVLGVTLLAEDAESVTVGLHGIVREPGLARPLSWVSRTHRLSRGEMASLTIFPRDGVPGIEFAAEHAAPPAAPAAPVELAAIRLTVTLALREGTGGRLLEGRKVRLAGPQPTEVVLESAGPSVGEALVLRLLPRARSEAGAELDLGVEVRAATAGASRRVLEERLVLGWDDVVELSGLSSPSAAIVVEIRPER